MTGRRLLEEQRKSDLGDDEEILTEFLDIDETRAIVLFGDAILDVDTGEGPLTHATTTEVEMFEPPPDIDPTDTDAISDLLTRFVDRVATAGETTATRLD